MKSKSALDMVISISLDYPEINVVKYNAEQNVIIMEIALSEEITEKIIQSFFIRVRQSIIAYKQMEGIQADIIDLQYNIYSGITFVRIFRDVRTLTKDEVGLIMRLFTEEFNSIVCKDEISGFKLESLRRQVKNDILMEVIKSSNKAYNFKAYRDRGRIFISNN